MDRLESLPAADGVIDVAWMTADTWWQVDPPDIRGFQWRSPGTYVIATDRSGTAIASIKINYVHRLDGSHLEEAAAAIIAEALVRFYDGSDA